MSEAAPLAGVRHVRLPAGHPLAGHLVDVAFQGGRIADIAPVGALSLRGPTVDGDGAWIRPGFWDHHLHVTAWALDAERVPLGAARSAAEAARRMSNASPDGDGRRIGVGFRDALWSDAPSLELIDAATGDVPSYLVNADLHSAWLNTAAFRREGMTPTPDGVLREGPAFDVTRRLGDVSDVHRDAAVERAFRAAAARGITGVVDLDMDWNVAAWRRRVEAGWTTARVRFGVYPEHLERAIAEGLHTGWALPGGLVEAGSLKIIADGSLGTRTAAVHQPYPGGGHGVMNVSDDELENLLFRATGAGWTAAVHAIGDHAGARVLDAFARTGARGTIEHAQLLARHDLIRLARLGIGASVQPAHAHEDRELARRFWGRQTSLAYPLRSLVDAGANVLFGSDGPVSPSEPRLWVAAAVAREPEDAVPFLGDEALSRELALAACTWGGTLGGAGIDVGRVADVVLLDRDPVSSPDAGEWEVLATVVDGRTSFLSL